jgi:hypothetical protein
MLLLVILELTIMTFGLFFLTGYKQMARFFISSKDADVASGRGTSVRDQYAPDRTYHARTTSRRPYRYAG